MKRPSFQFYPADWLRDTALRSCSTGARGLWIDMICYMHEGNPYGHLKVGDKVILPTNLARMVGETLEVVQGWLDELKVAGVYDIGDDGVIISRRMIRDENLREIRAKGGKLGGNPALMKADKVNLDVNHKVEIEDKQIPTPSSSSLSSNKKIIITCPENVSESTWNDFVALRKTKKAPVTPTVIDGIAREATKLGWSLERAMQEMCTQGWQGFKADWLKPKDQKSTETGFARIPL